MKTGLPGLGAALLVGAALPALAQSIDHGPLEALFQEPVTTSATGLPQRLSDVPANMVIITQDQIRRSGATSIPEVLRNVAGVDVATWASGQQEVAIRGYTQTFQPRLLVLINGQQIYEDTYGYVVWSVLPVQLDEIRQIEVVKGPNSALFGFTAAAGVINIITSDPISEPLNVATVRVGTQGHREASAVATVNEPGRAGLRVSAGGFNSDDFDDYLVPRHSDLASIVQSRSAAFNAAVRASKAVSLGLNGSYSRSGRLNYPPPAGEPADSNTERWSILGRTGIDFRPGFLELTAYHNKAFVTSRGAITGGTGSGNDVTVVRGQYLFQAPPDHSFRLTTEFRRNSSDTLFLPVGKLSYQVFAGGGLWSWNVSPEVALTNAVRVDHLNLERLGAFPPLYPFAKDDYDQSLTEVSFNSGLVWKPSSYESVRFIAGRGVQLPSLAELGLVQTLPIRGIILNIAGNPDLEPTRVTQLEALYDRRIDAIDGSGRVSIFWQHNDALRRTPGAQPDGRVFGPPNSVGFFSIFDSIGESRAIGTEIEVRGRFWDHWTWDASYSFQTLMDDFDNYRGAAIDGVDFENGNPQHMVNAHIGYARGPWEADLYLNWRSGYRSHRLDLANQGFVAVDIDAGAVLSGRIGYALTENLTLALSAQNLEGGRRDTIGATPERRLFFTIQGRY